MRCANQELRRFRPEVGRLEERALLSTFVVSNLADDGAGSLRREVALSNLTPGPDTIRFAPGLTGEIHLTSGQLALTDAVNIQGPGANQISVTGNTDRIFDVQGITASITGLTLQNGVADTGGAIRNLNGNLVTRYDNFVGNTARVLGGAVWNFAGHYASQNDTFVANTGGFGGAIENAGTMSVKDDTFVANTAQLGGGAILNALVFSTLLPGAKATITDSSFTGNSAIYGGAVANQNGSSITMDQDRFTTNTATGSSPNLGGGAFFNAWRPGEGDSATISRSTFTGNSAPQEGGAIHSEANLILIASTLQFNTAAVGGAVWALNGTFTPIANTIQFNSQPEVFLA